jgi:hypothetical protein
MSIPWHRNDQLGGEYIYNPNSDEVVLRDGRRFRRPLTMPRNLFQAAAWTGPLPPYQPQPVSNSRAYQLRSGPLDSQRSGLKMQTSQVQSGQSRTFQRQPGQGQSGQSQLLQRRPSHAQAGQSQVFQKQPGQAQASQFQARQMSQPQGGHIQMAGQGRAQPRTLPGAAGAAGVQQLTKAMRNTNLAAGAPNTATNQVQTMRVQQNGSEFLYSIDPRSGVQAIVQNSPPTPEDLQAEGVIVRQRLAGTEGNVERLFPDYIIRQARFFSVGRVFLVLWAEPAGGNTGTVVTVQQQGTILNHLGERVFSKVRRFVVIRESRNYCSALPITTYTSRGVSKKGVVKSEHAIIYTGRIPPQPLQNESPSRGETGMRPEAIRVDPDSATDILDPMSRIDFGGVHQVQHNIKTKSLGMVSQQSINALHSQFRQVWEDQLRSRSRPPGERQQAQVTQRMTTVAGAAGFIDAGAGGLDARVVGARATLSASNTGSGSDDDGLGDDSD